MIDAVLNFVWVALLWGAAYLLLGGVIGVIVASVNVLTGAREPITIDRIKNGLHLILWLAVFWPGALAIAFVMSRKRK